MQDIRLWLHATHNASIGSGPKARSRLEGQSEGADAVRSRPSRREGPDQIERNMTMEHILTTLLHQIWQILNYDFSSIIDRLADAFFKSCIMPPFHAYVLPELQRFQAWFFWFLRGPVTDVLVIFFMFCISVGAVIGAANDRGPWN